MSEEHPRKLIEIALPLEAISKAAVDETAVPRRGHPSTLHVWWARRPLAACRAVLFSSLVDDPSSHPDLYSEQEANNERARLFRLIEQLVKWDSTTDDAILDRARNEIRRSTQGHPPRVLDPFCGRGVIPLEAQRLGLETYASDINPVAVLITRALIEIPPTFRDCQPVNPNTHERLAVSSWTGSSGIAADIRYYGAQLRTEMEGEIGDLYPKAKLPDGSEATVVAWIWARTVRCPNPACGAEMPLVKSFMLSSKKSRPAWATPIVDQTSKKVKFRVHTGQGQPPESPKMGRGAKFRCVACDEIALEEYIKQEGVVGRLETRLMAIVAEGKRGRVYLSPTREHEELAQNAVPMWEPDQDLALDPRNIWCIPYGLSRVADLFTKRQLVALTTVGSLATTMRERVIRDAQAAGMAQDDRALTDGGIGARAYAEVIVLSITPRSK